MTTDEETTEKDRLLEKEDGDECWFQSRHALAVMSFLGFFNLYCLRFNLSVALVAMVNSTSEDTNVTNDECLDVNLNSTSVSTGEFSWDEKTQGIILGSFFFGYIVTQLPGGWLAERIGGKKLLGFGILSAAVLTLLTPMAARAGIPYLIIVRVLEGLGEGVSFPAMHAMWAEWAPVYERSRLASFTYSGPQLGIVFVMAISGVLCDHGFAGGWPSVFYVFGALGCVWFIFWMLLVHDSPAQHPRISYSERQYIESSIGRREHLPTPWRHILTSPAVWGVSIAHFSSNWGLYSMLTCLPTYLKRILHFDITKSGFLSGVPYLVLWIMQILSGFIADFLRKNGYLSTGATRKLLNTTGFILPAALLVCTGYTGCNYSLAVALLTLGVAGSGFTMSGFKVNHLDIAPRFAGTLMGITNFIATIPGILGPGVVGILTNNNETSAQWRVFFYITAAIYLSGAFLFVVIGKGEEQEWAKASPSPPPPPTGAEVTIVPEQQHSAVSVQDATATNDNSASVAQMDSPVCCTGVGWEEADDGDCKGRIH